MRDAGETPNDGSLPPPPPPPSRGAGRRMQTLDGNFAHSAPFFPPLPIGVFLSDLPRLRHYILLRLLCRIGGGSSWWVEGLASILGSLFVLVQGISSKFPSSSLLPSPFHSPLHAIHSCLALFGGAE